VNLTVQEKSTRCRQRRLQHTRHTQHPRKAPRLPRKRASRTTASSSLTYLVVETGLSPKRAGAKAAAEATRSRHWRKKAFMVELLIDCEKTVARRKKHVGGTRTDTTENRRIYGCRKTKSTSVRAHWIRVMDFSPVVVRCLPTTRHQQPPNHQLLVEGRAAFFSSRRDLLDPSLGWSFQIASVLPTCPPNKVSFNMRFGSLVVSAFLLAATSTGTVAGFSVPSTGTFPVYAT
jgi:hypothetical protein